MFANQNSYDELIFRKNPKYILFWLIFIILLLIFLVVVGCLYKYNKFYQVNGLVIKEGSDDYVQILFENDKLDIIKHADLIVDSEITNFDYLVSSYFYSDSGKAYREIKIFFNDNFENGEIVQLTFKTPQTTMIKEIKNKIKKGMI